MAGKTTRKAAAKKRCARRSTPLYGIEGQGWFLNFHCFARYIKVAFFRGTSLRPVPPGESRHKDVRYLDIRENDQLDEAQMATWIRQAAAVPGWIPDARGIVGNGPQSGSGDDGWQDGLPVADDRPAHS